MMPAALMIGHHRSISSQYQNLRAGLRPRHSVFRRVDLDIYRIGSLIPAPSRPITGPRSTGSSTGAIRYERAAGPEPPHNSARLPRRAFLSHTTRCRNVAKFEDLHHDSRRANGRRRRLESKPPRPWTLCASVLSDLCRSEYRSSREPWHTHVLRGLKSS